MVGLAILLTLVCGFGMGLLLPEFGIIAAVAVMGGFILYAIRHPQSKE